MEAVLEGIFNLGYAETKQSLYDELKSRKDAVIVNAMKEYLREKGIEIALLGNSLERFKQIIDNRVDDRTKLELANIENTLNRELGQMIEDLKDGSQTAFSKFTEGITSISMSATEMVARATAIKAAYTMSPTIGTAALGASIVLPAALRATKDIKSKSEEDVKTALDVLLVRLTMTVDNGRTKFDIPKTIMENVRENLIQEGINVNSDDALMFMKDISKLDNEKKERVVNVINNFKGNIFDVKEELKGVKINLKNIKNAVEKDVVAPISTAAMIGLTTAGTLNDIASDAVPSIITGLGIGAVTGNTAMAIGAASTQYGASKILSGVPWIGTAMERLNQIETTAATTGVIVGGTIAFKVIPGLVYKGAKGIYEKMKAAKVARNGRIGLEDGISERLNQAQDNVENELVTRSDKDIMLDIVRDVLRERGVELPKHVTTSEEIKSYIRNLENDDKKQVYRVVSVLEDIKEDSNYGLKETLKTVAKTAYWGGVLALAGLGMYDTFINPGFLDGLRMKNELENSLDKIKNSSDPTKIRYTEDGRILTIDEKGGTVLEIGEDLTKENITEKVITSIRKEAERNHNEAIEEFKTCLPKSEIEFENFIEPNYSIFENSDPAVRRAFDALNLDTNEGLYEFLRNIDENDENLIAILKMFNAQSIDDLMKDYDFVGHISVIGKNNSLDVPLPEGAESWGFIQSFNEGSKHILNQVTQRKKIKKLFIDMINENVRESLSDIPTQSASNEEIMKFIASLEENPEKLDMISKYAEVMDTKKANRVAENLKDSFRTLLNGGKYIKDEEAFLRRLEEIQENIGSIGLMQAKVQEVLNKQDTITKVAESNMTANPYEVAGVGSAVGIGVGAVVASGKKKGVFSRMKAFILDKMFPNKKKRALPAPTISLDEAIRDVQIANKADNDELNVKVANEDLKPFESSTSVVKHDRKEER